MKFNIYVIGLIGILGITPLCYAESSTEKTSIQELKQETQDFVQMLDAYTADQKDELMRNTKIALDKLDKRIDDVEASVDESWDKMDKDARKKSRDSLKALRKQRNQLAEWYGRLKSNTENASVHMKKGFSDAYEDLIDAWEKSENEFGSSP